MFSESTFQLLRLRSELRGDTYVVEAHGELDLSTCDAFVRELRGAGASGAKEILLDLNGLEFIDCAGVDAIVRMDERSRKRGRRFVVDPGPLQVRRVFWLTGAASRLSFAPKRRG
ncbi:MAG TPA: STAS domain-containing protein [Thermoleophilaceae bacterium]|jgi:anti-sigma B factor antagonist